MCSLYLCKVYLLYSAKYKVTLYYESLQQVHYSSTLHIGWHTCFLYEMFELLRIRSISQYLAAHFDPPQPFVRPWLTSWSTIVAPILGLFCLFLWFASVPYHHASLLLFFLSAFDPDCFLYVHPFSEFLTFVLSSVYVCFPIEGSWDAPLSYFRELVYHWLI